MDVFSELISAQLENKSAAPVAAIPGKVWWRTDTNKIQIDSGSAIKDVVTEDAVPALVVANTPIIKRTILRSSGYASGSSVDTRKPWPLGGGDVVRTGLSFVDSAPQIIYLKSSEYPSVGSKVAKLNVRAQIYTNDTSPGVQVGLGLYPVTRPGTSGASGSVIYTLGTVVSGSQPTIGIPAADLLYEAHTLTSFSIPADGHYCFAFIVDSAMASAADFHITATLELVYE
jgi:hypothetical protein